MVSILSVSKSITSVKTRVSTACLSLIIYLSIIVHNILQERLMLIELQYLQSDFIVINGRKIFHFYCESVLLLARTVSVRDTKLKRQTLITSNF